MLLKYVGQPNNKEFYMSILTIENFLATDEGSYRCEFSEGAYAQKHIAIGGKFQAFFFFGRICIN